MTNKLESIADMNVDGIANVVDFVIKPSIIGALGIILIGYLAHYKINELNQELSRVQSSCYTGER